MMELQPAAYLLPVGLCTGLTKSAEVDSIALRSFGWGDVAALTSVGAGAASVFCFCVLGWADATAFTKFGAGGPQFEARPWSDDFVEVGEGDSLHEFGRRRRRAFKRSVNAEQQPLQASARARRGFKSADEDEGDTVSGQVFGKACLSRARISCGGLQTVFGSGAGVGRGYRVLVDRRSRAWEKRSDRARKLRRDQSRTPITKPTNRLLVMYFTLQNFANAKVPARSPLLQ